MSVLQEILDCRGLDKCPLPLWKLRLSDEEYEGLKQTLKDHQYDLHNYGIEAAICYAEWWRRDYSGNIPSKEDVAYGIGLDWDDAQDLYMAARNALKELRCTFIHSLKGTEYFRTLLNQGGLPVNYIKGGNLGGFTSFLQGLVRNLSLINYDWNNEDHSIIQQFNCISYLGNSFKNENIYDVSMQIAHAIIREDTSLLPYDDSDTSLAELTEVLQKEYIRAKRERNVRPLSLHWKLVKGEAEKGYLFVNMDVVKEISSESIPGLNTSTCYSFDIFVAGTLMGKYVRKSVKRDEKGNILYAIYTRISVGMTKDVLWKGEQVVEVKVRCDNDDRIFLTIAGCYPPNFDYPQVFQMLEQNVYIQSKTANSESNMVVFSSEWQTETENTQRIIIAKNELNYADFTKEVKLDNNTIGESITITNTFTPYSVEFSGTYMPWVEQSNYKLLSKVPFIKVYDKDKNQISKSSCKTFFRKRGSDLEWKKFSSSTMFPIGLIDIKIVFPDEQYAVETFYSVGDLKFESQKEKLNSTEILCSSSQNIRVEIESLENVNIENLESGHWKISRFENSTTCPSVCYFRVYSLNNPILRFSVAIPFDGVMITDVNGNIVPKSKIISLANLSYFSVISHGSRNRTVEVSYSSDNLPEDERPKRLKSKVINGIVSLSDYSELITRMFNLYGLNSFDRSSSVSFRVGGQEIFIRKFVLESSLENGNILINDFTEWNTEDFDYDASLYAFPVGDDLPTSEFYPIKLEKVESEKNVFKFPEEFHHNEVVVFTSTDTNRRVIPKYYNREETDYDKEFRASRSKSLTERWVDFLTKEDLFTGKHWRDVCKAYEICSIHNLPFTTYNGLKAAAREPELLAKLVIAMWLNEYKDVFYQDINRFEQELFVALHWIPAKTWNKCFNDFMGCIPEQMQDIIFKRIEDLVSLIQDLFNSTVSTDIAEEFKSYVFSGVIEAGKRFTNQEINNFKMKVHGLTDNNQDLPVIKFYLQKNNYYSPQEMLPSYRVMIDSAICAAENACGLTDKINLFSYEGKQYARIVNFYRKYFKETYSEIFIKTIKLLSTINK